MTLVAAAVLAQAAAAPAAITLEFYRANTLNDPAIAPGAPITSLTLTVGGAPAFVQIVLHQTAPNTNISAMNGLHDFIFQGTYGANQVGVFVVPGATPTATAPLLSIGSQFSPSTGPFGTGGAFLTGVGGTTLGGNQSTATGFRLGGFSTVVPSPNVGADGRLLLGAVQINAVGAGASSIVFGDPPTGNPDFFTDDGTVLDPIIFPGGATYPLQITVQPTGSCCDVFSGACSVTEQSACTSGPFIPGGSCNPNPCAGSCCDFLTSACRISGQLGCGGGAFTQGGTCDPVPCAGACCNTLTSQCTTTTPAQCIGGTWFPGLCAARPCPGACCDLVTGMCSLLPENQCPTGNRIFLGGACTPSRCPSGACCTTNSMCRVTGPTGCSDMFMPERSCSPNPCLGACCDPATSQCTLLAESACTSGSWFPGPCQARPCPGACCDLVTGMCSVLPENQCFTGNRIFLGGACTPSRCPSGACCTTNSMCRVTGPTGCSDMFMPERSCSPNPCLGACCDPATSQCTLLAESACTSGSWFPGPCQARPCPGACCDLFSGTCSVLPENQCFRQGTLFFGGACTPTRCPSGTCCIVGSGTCRISGPEGCFGGQYTEDEACDPNPCPAACCDPTTGNCTVIPQSACTGLVVSGFGCQPSPCPPIALCRDVTLDVSSSCQSLTVTPEQVDNGSHAAIPNCPVTLSLAPSGPYPIGDTTVTLTVTDCNNRVSTCTATIHVLGSDCNHDGIPDVCQCLWDNGRPRGNLDDLNGQLSHFGGGAGDGHKVADDFYLCPGHLHRIFAFSGEMLTSLAPALRKARLELYEDCNGSPAAAPIKTWDTTTWTHIAGPGIDGLDLVRYDFDLCQDADGATLWLEGGRAYWWSLIGLGVCGGLDQSSWAVAAAPVAGSTPVKADGTAVLHCYPTAFDDWQPLDECCIGCANMSYRVFGKACPIIWNQSPALQGGGAGGIRSENLSPTQHWRGADDFVVKPCADEKICLIDAWIWSDCNPVRGFVEIYRNDCRHPGTPFVTLTEPTVIPTDQSITIDGHERDGYILRFEPSSLTLEKGQTWWLTAGAERTGSQNARTYFAYAGNCATICPRHGFPSQASVPPLPVRWTDVGPDLAFRVAAAPVVEELPVVIGPPPEPACRADINRNGQLTVQDIFDFLTAWFAGCP